MRKNIAIIFVVMGLNTTIVSALVISEIMYDPQGSDTDREWIEVLNDTQSSIDMTGWKFFEANTNHGLAISQGTAVLLPGEYAIIADVPAKFLQDNPTYQGKLFDSSFSLSNTGELIAMKDTGGTIKDSLAYITSLGGNDDNTTLSLIGGAWVRGDKTPGASNQLSATPVSGNSGTNTNTSTTTDTSPTIAPNMSSPASELGVFTKEERIVIVGADSEFSARVASGSGKSIENAQFIWSFGDGGTRSGRSVGYHYDYPGVYIAVVEASADGMTATARTRVRVVAPELSFARIGNEGGAAYVEIKNDGVYDVDLSNWKLEINNLMYPFPKNTFLPAKGTIRFAGRAMGFASTTMSNDTNLRLRYPDSTEALTYTKGLMRVATSTNVFVQALDSLRTKTEVYTPKQNSVSTKKISASSSLSSDVRATTSYSTSTNVLEKQKKDRGLFNWVSSFFGK